MSIRPEPRPGLAGGVASDPEMVENEGILLRRFRDQVPMGVERSLLMDLAQLRYRLPRIRGSGARGGGGPAGQGRESGRAEGITMSVASAPRSDGFGNARRTWNPSPS